MCSIKEWISGERKRVRMREVSGKSTSERHFCTALMTAAEQSVAGVSQSTLQIGSVQSALIGIGNS